MATERKLAIVLTGEDRSASKTLRNVSDEVDNTSGKLANLGSKISPAVTAAAASVVAGVGFALKGAFDADFARNRTSHQDNRRRLMDYGRTSFGPRRIAFKLDGRRRRTGAINGKPFADVHKRSQRGWRRKRRV